MSRRVIKAPSELVVGTRKEFMAVLVKVISEISEALERILGKTWVLVAPCAPEDRPHVGIMTQDTITEVVGDETERPPKVELKPPVASNVAAAGKVSAAALSGRSWLKAEASAIHQGIEYPTTVFKCRSRIHVESLARSNESRLSCGARFAGAAAPAPTAAAVGHTNTTLP